MVYFNLNPVECVLLFNYYDTGAIVFHLIVKAVLICHVYTPPLHVHV